MASHDEEQTQPPAAGADVDPAWMDKLDSRADNAANNEVDHEAVSKAMEALQQKPSRGPPAAKGQTTLAVRPNVKVDAGDVALLVDELEITKPRATELLKAHSGDAIKVLRAYVAAQ